MTQLEQTVALQLKKWFESNGVKCWLNQGEEKFQTKKSQKKPDLIIYSERLKQYIAVELKKGDSAKDVYDAGKIIEYWEEYELGNIEYYIDDIKIKIDSFTVATLFSMFGKLFKEDEVLNVVTEDSFKAYCKQTGLEPIHEFQRTHDYLRHLWSQWRKKRKAEPQAGLGVILSTVLNQEEITLAIGAPLLFDIQYEDQARKPKWQNRQKTI